MPWFGGVAAFAWLGGAGAALLLPGLPSLGVAVAACGAFLPLAIAPTRLRWLAIGAFAFAYTCLRADLAMSERLAFARDGVAQAVDIRIVGLVQRERDGVRFDAVIDGVGRVRLTSFDRNFARRTGTRWRIDAKLRRPRGLVNPGGFDFERHALASRLSATGYVRRFESPLPAHRFDAPRSYVDRFREGYAAFVERRPDHRSASNHDAAPHDVRSEQGAALVRALAIGDTAAIDDTTWDVFRATGTTHLVAISGLHVGLVASLGLLLARALYFAAPTLGERLPRPKADALGALLFATGYALLAGSSLPVLRTLLMIAVALASRWFERHSSPGHALSLAAVALLVFDPLSLLAPGFWLSFAGVAWLLFCLAGRPRTSLLRGFGRAQLAVSIGLAPLTIALFGQVSLIGPAANLFAVPWISFVCVPLSLASVACHAMAPAIADPILQVASASVDVALATLAALGRLDHAELHWPAPHWSAAALALIGVAWLLLPRGVPARPLGLALMLPVAFPSTPAPPPGAVDVHVLDVGQGLSVLIRTPRHAVLYDAGPGDAGRFDLGASVVAPSLRALGVRRLDALVVSHEDLDHAGGAASVIRAFRPDVVYRHRATGGAIACEAGRRFALDDVRFEFLHPPPHFPALGNESSCVLRVSIGARAVLLPGDIGHVVEARLGRAGPDLRADLLVVPHHGSGGSSGARFLAAVAPERAIFSRGYRNRFGHPPAAVVRRYAEAGIGTFDTAVDGALAFRVTRDGIAPIGRARVEKAATWREPAVVE